jgi:hypothetical protein
MTRIAEPTPGTLVQTGAPAGKLPEPGLMAFEFALPPGEKQQERPQRIHRYPNLPEAVLWRPQNDPHPPNNDPSLPLIAQIRRNPRSVQDRPVTKRPTLPNKAPRYTQPLLIGSVILYGAYHRAKRRC